LRIFILHQILGFLSTQSVCAQLIHLCIHRLNPISYGYMAQ
jgi:hypothetical protein